IVTGDRKDREMHVAFINPQGNFDPNDSYWTQHPDFGGQLVYVKELALAMGNLDHKVDIVTRRVIDPEWPEFESETDFYPDAPNVRILRIPCGPDEFLVKEDLWPYLCTEFVPNLLKWYEEEGPMPDAVTSHYGDGGLCAVYMEEQTGIPFSFTAHSLGAQKMDKMGVSRKHIEETDEKYKFSRRIVGERLSMNRSAVNITSTSQERFNQYTHSAYRGSIDPTDDNRFAAVPPGVALHIFDKAAEYEQEDEIHRHVQESLERDLDQSRVDLPCVVASSRLDPKKNHLALVEAFASSPVLREHANLVIFTGGLENPLEGYKDADEGEREVLDSLMRVIERDELRGEVSMFSLSSQRELAAAYRYLAGMRSVFTLTANYEPFGLAPLEAMAAGLPAVVTKYGGPSESLRSGDEQYGILVDPSDAEEVSAGLYKLVGYEDEWKEYAEAGYNRVIEHYTWERTAERYLEAIKGEERDTEDVDGDTTTLAAGHPNGHELDSENGYQVVERLPIPTFFTDPESGDLSTETLDQLYFALDVLSVGETVVDFISHDMVHSLRTANSFTRYLGGQPANLAVYIAKLGGRSAILSKVGTDHFSEYLEDQLQRHGVSTESLQKSSESPTTNVFVTRTVSVPDFQVNRGADSLLNMSEVTPELVARARVVHTSAFALSKDPQRLAARRAMRLAHRHGQTVSLDPNYDPRIWPNKDEAWEVLAEVLPYVTVVKPSLEDARRLFDYNMEEEDLREACLNDFHKLGADVVLFTSSGGVVTISDGESVEEIGPLTRVEIKNVTGASDTFWAGLLTAHLEGQDWPTCVKFAHEVAKIKLVVEGHVDRMIPRSWVYDHLSDAVQKA
ncbi:MAG: PfkB family carbohydrate kinase, partial [Rubrobacteraceae bacterium]